MKLIKCQGCGNDIPQQGISPNQYGKRKFCSRKCSEGFSIKMAAHRTHTVKNCKTCGKEIVKQRHQSKKRYSERMYCSKECHYKDARENEIGWFSKANSPFELNADDREAIAALKQFKYIISQEQLLKEMNETIAN